MVKQRSAPKTLLNVAKQPLSILGDLVLVDLVLKRLLKMLKPPSTGGLKIGGLRLGKANLLLTTIFGAFDFISRRKDNDNDGKPDQTMVQPHQVLRLI